MKHLYFFLVVLVAVIVLMPPHAVQAFVATSYHGVLAVPGRAYYVDSVNGNDSNNGLSPSQAFQTIARLTSADAEKHINTWKLADNSDWREELDIPRSNMTIEAYGAGTKPLLDGSDVIPTSSWSLVSGTINCYQATATIITNPANAWVNVFENGNFLVRDNPASTSTCNSVSGSYYPSTDFGNGTTSFTLYIHPSDNSNPATNGKLYEYTARQFALYSAGVNTTVNGIWARRALHNDSAFAMRAGTKLLNCQATDFSDHAIIVGDNSLIDGCTVQNGYWGTNNNAAIVVFDSAGIVNPKGATISNTTLSQNVPAAIAEATTALMAHTDASFVFPIITVTNVTATGWTVTNGFNNTTAATLTNLTSNSEVTGASGMTLTLNACHITQAALSALNTSGNTIVNGGTLTVTGSTSNGIVLLQGGATLTIENGAILTATSSVNGVYVNHTGSSIALNNSTISLSTSGNNVFLTSPDLFTYTGNNNTFIGTNNWWKNGGTLYTSLSAWQTATGQDANSTSTP
jgi:hypothetical protein